MHIPISFYARLFDRHYDILGYVKSAEEIEGQVGDNKGDNCGS